MKVCLLNESFPPVIDGVVNVMMNYADYMMRDYGAEIEVGTPEYPDGKYDDYPYEVVAYPSFDTATDTGPATLWWEKPYRDLRHSSPISFTRTDPRPRWWWRGLFAR